MLDKEFLSSLICPMRGVPHTGIDMLLRQYKWIDDFFEIIGSRFFKSRAT